MGRESIPCDTLSPCHLCPTYLLTCLQADNQEVEESRSLHHHTQQKLVFIGHSQPNGILNPLYVLLYLIHCCSCASHNMKIKSQKSGDAPRPPSMGWRAGVKLAQTWQIIILEYLPPHTHTQPHTQKQERRLGLHWIGPKKAGERGRNSTGKIGKLAGILHDQWGQGRLIPSGDPLVHISAASTKGHGTKNKCCKTPLFKQGPWGGLSNIWKLALQS